MAEAPVEGAGRGAVVLGAEGAALLNKLAMEQGIICSSCQAPMDSTGIEALSLRVEMRERPTAIVGRQFICDRPQCAEAKADAISRATAVRPAGNWTVFTKQEREEGDEPAE